MEEAIAAQLASGEFDTPEQVINAGLTLLAERQKKIKALQKALQQGRDSGYLDHFDWESHRKQLEADHLGSGG